MQAGSAALQQAFAESRDDIEAKRADAVYVVAVAFELAPHPARQFGTAGIGKTCQLGEAEDGHDAGNDRDVDASGSDFVDEMEVGVGVVEVLGDRRVGARLGLAHEIRQVVTREARLRMPFGIGPDFQAKMVAGFGADELDKFVGIAELSGFGHARGQVAA